MVAVKWFRAVCSRVVSVAKRGKIVLFHDFFRLARKDLDYVGQISLTPSRDVGDTRPVVRGLLGRVFLAFRVSWKVVLYSEQPRKPARVLRL